MTGHKGSCWITAHEFTDLMKGACIGDNVSVNCELIILIISVHFNTDNKLLSAFT